MAEIKLAGFLTAIAILVVGLAMIGKTLALPYLPVIVSQVIGGLIVIMSIFTVLGIFGLKFTK